MKTIIVSLVIASIAVLTISSVSSSGSTQIRKGNVRIKAEIENIK